ncbi:MAG TPA: hypothetical protein VEC36_01635 [Patescibacteria group bacterium]|nr:hypothetical protein [Patescibacteria group bacterium]
MRNRIYLAAAFIVFTLASCVSPPRASKFVNVPLDSLKPHVINVEEYKSKYAKYDGVYLDVNDHREHYLGNGGWQLYHVRTIKYVVLNPNTESLTTFNITADPSETLTGVFMHVFSPDGTVKKYTASDLVVEKTSYGARTYKFAYPDIKPGTVIEEGFELRHSNQYDPTLDHDIPLQYTMPCEHLSQSVTYPKSWVMQVKRIAPNTVPGIKKTESADKQSITLAYEAIDVPAREDEIYSPYFKEYGKYFEMMFTHIMTPGGFYNGPDSWSKLSSQFTKYVLDKESFWSSSVRHAMKEATKDAKTDEEKFESIISYIQQNIKLSRGSSSDDFTDMLHKKEGNLIMLTSLAHAMLNKTDIKADFLLIHTARDGYFDPDYITADQLYIPAVSAEINGRTFVAFPWLKRLPVTVIPEYFQGETALKIGQKGFNGFMKVPSGTSTADNVTEENFHVSIDEEGLLTVQEEKTYRGTNAFSKREDLADLKKDELDKEIRKMLTYSEGDVQIKNYTIEHLEEYKKPLSIRIEYTIDNLVTVTPEEIIFQTGGLFSPSSAGGSKVDTSERKTPIRIYYDEQSNKNITLKYPEGWKLSSTLSNVERVNSFGSVEGRFEQSPGMLQVHQQRILKQASAPKEKFGELLELVSRQSRLSVPTLVFKTGL